MSKFIALLCAAAMAMTASTAVFADDAATDTAANEVVETTETADATETPSEEATEAADAAEAPSEEATEAADATEAPSEEATEAADATEAPSEEATEAADATEAPSEEATEVPSEEAVNPFEDCQDEWFTDAVTYVYTNGLIKGYDDVTFGPQDNVTRDQLAVILYRQNAEGDIVTEGENWADEAEAWVSANGIMAEFLGDSFEGSTALTREQIVSTIYKTYQLSNIAADGAELTEFVDADSIIEYAVDAFKWAVAAGVIEGNDDLEINPTDNVTRAETSAILQRYLTKLTFTAPTEKADEEVADGETADEETSDADAADETADESSDTEFIDGETSTEEETPEEIEASEADDAPVAE
ncbi:MAG: S-layer homology domain-containing protein [Oscillospiraceae bacterium]|nr:S-layer homology domain-containing protein [Oscillospiraceae bacterium]